MKLQTTVHITHQMLHAVIRLGNSSAVEGVRLHKICTGLHILQMDVKNHIRASENEHVVVALKRLGVILKLLS